MSQATNITLTCPVTGNQIVTSLNTTLAALNSSNSGTAAPTNNVVEGMLWYDTTDDIIKVRVGSSWVSILDNVSNSGLSFAGTNATFAAGVSVTGALDAGSLTVSGVDIDGSDSSPSSGNVPVLDTLNLQDAALNRYELTKTGTGSGNVIQAFAVDEYTGELFTMHASGTPENLYIHVYEANGRRVQTSYAASTGDNTIGHQELDISYDKDGVRWFWTAAPSNINDTPSGLSTTNYGDYVTRFQISVSGSVATVSNEEYYKLFTKGSVGNATTGISLDGLYLISEFNTSSEITIRVFDLPVLLDGGEANYSGDSLFEFTVANDNTGGVRPLQSIASDGSLIYIFIGDGSTVTNNICHVYSLNGTLIQTIDDYIVGGNTLTADGDANFYEMEGAGWVNHGGSPRLSISVSTGASGSRINRIWLIGAATAITGYGTGGRPAFISSGSNDYAVPAGEACRFGHYEQETDTFTERASFDSDGVWGFGAGGTGAFTIGVEDSSGNVSSTTGTGHYSRIGNLMFIRGTINNVNTTGLTSGNNARITGSNPTAGGFTFTPIAKTVMGGIQGSDFDIATNVYQTHWSLATGGYLEILESKDNAGQAIANVSQVNGADLNFGGVFMVA